MARQRRKITNTSISPIQIAGRWIQPGGIDTFDVEQLPPEWKNAGVVVDDQPVVKVPAMISPGSTALEVIRDSAQGVVKGIAPSGTVAADGTITLGTALPAAFAEIALYLPAGAIAGSSEGFYFVEMSSATVGVVLDRLGGAAMTGSGSAYTGATSEVTLRSEVLVGAENFAINAQFSVSNSVGTKTGRLRIGTSQGIVATATSSVGLGFSANVSRITKYMFSASNAVANGSTSAIAFVAPDSQLTASITGQLSAPTDFILMVASRVIIGG